MDHGGLTARRSDEDPSSPTLRLMVIDDDPFARDVIATILSQLGDGTAIRAFESGAAAIATVADFQPDVVILDLVMPGMDGRTTWQTLRGRLSKPAHLILLSAAAPEAAAVMEASAVLAKPFPSQALVETIRRLTGRPNVPAQDSARAARLEAVARAFGRSLEATAVKLIEAWTVLAVGWDPDSAATLLAESHRLAGSADLFKYSRLGTQADRLEHLLRPIIAAGWKTDNERHAIESAVQALITACEATGRDAA